MCLYIKKKIKIDVKKINVQNKETVISLKLSMKNEFAQSNIV